MLSWLNMFLDRYLFGPFWRLSWVILAALERFVVSGRFRR